MGTFPMFQPVLHPTMGKVFELGEFVDSFSDFDVAGHRMELRVQPCFLCFLGGTACRLGKGA